MRSLRAVKTGTPTPMKGKGKERKMLYNHCKHATFDGEANTMVRQLQENPRTVF
jgi:hypothetical protein